MALDPKNIDEITSLRPDVIVVGSGAAGMAAALCAAQKNLRTLVLEAAHTFGGTTAVSGGVLWVPNNHHMPEHGIHDDLESAVQYVTRVSQGKSPDTLIRAWLENAPRVAKALEEVLQDAFLALPTYPDYQPELPGGKTGGRSLDNPLFNTHDLGPWRETLRKNPITGRAPMTIGEAMEWGVFSKPFDYPYKKVGQRAKDGVVHGGAALMGRSLQRGLELGATFVRNARVTDLIYQDGRVQGVRAQIDAHNVELHASAVILASGGFEWSDAQQAAFMPRNQTRPASPPTLRGDALHMTQKLGVALGCMAEAWWAPVVKIPDETYDNAPLYRSEFSVRCLPHSIIVNAQGRRFVNEALNYNDVVKPFLHFDPVRYLAQNEPAWLIVDGNYLKQYVFVTAVPGRPLPDYIIQAESLDALAHQCAIDADGLRSEVERFNGFVAQGKDEDFQRGEGAFERFYGDPSYTQNPNLGAIDQAPFCAVPIYRGCIGTKGGPVTNAHAQVLRTDHTPIEGLYAAGNAMASPAGSGYPGAGSTIGIALTFGWLAAEHVAKQTENA